MKKYKRTLLPPFAAVTVGAVLLSLPVLAEGPTYEKDFQPIVQQFFFFFFDGERIKGDLDLERFKTDKDVVDSIAIWQRIAKRHVTNCHTSP